MDIFQLFNENTHTGYIVADAAAALEVMQKKFQCCQTTEPYLFSPSRVWCMGERMSKLPVTRIVMCRIREGLAFEFIEPISKCGFHYLQLLTHGDHMNHVAFQTEKYETCREMILAEGAPILFEAETNDRLNGYRRCLYTKIDGFPGLLELQEKATPFKENFTID